MTLSATLSVLSPMRPGASLGARIALDWSLPGWSWQPKVNDERAVIHLPSGETFNRQGQPFCARKLEPFAPAITVLLNMAAWDHDWADLGLIGFREAATFSKSRGAIIVFDFPSRAPWSERRLELEQFPVLDLVMRQEARPGCIYSLPNTAEAGRLFAQTIGVPGLEGIIGRNENAPYVQGASREMVKARWAKG